MKKAVIYARFSCSAQTEQSIEGQLRVCYDYAKRNSILIIKEYIDRAKSGTTDARPSFQQMIKDCQSESWDYVLVYKLDRFSRDKYDSAVYKRTLKKHNIKVLSATENIPDTPEAIIFESVLEGFAQYYSAELAQKVKRGMTECYRKGQYTGGSALPYGYDVVNKKVIINEPESEIVKEIFDKYLHNYTGEEIANTLNERGITRKNGKPFESRFIYKLLNNTKYNGKVEHDGVIYDNIYPQIIDDNMWSAVAALHAQNSKKFGAAKPAYNYYLSSKLYCGHCKVKMSGISCVNSQKRKIRYYSCRNTVKAKDNCYNRYVRTQKLEETIFSAIKSLLFHTEICDYIAQQLIDYHKATNDNSNIIRRLLNSKTAIEEANNKLIDAISNGVDTLQMREKIKANEKEIALLSTQIELEKDKNHAELKKEDILKFLTSLNLESIETDPILKRMVIHTFIKYIFLYEDRIVIILNYEKSKQPETPSPNLFNEIEEISKADYDDNISAYTVMSGSPEEVKFPLFFVPRKTGVPPRHDTFVSIFLFLNLHYVNVYISKKEPLKLDNSRGQKYKLYRICIKLCHQ